MILEIMAKREIKFYKHYFNEFFVAQNEKVRRKIAQFDEGQLVILFNGFQKKTQKTPSGEIEKAERLMNEYFNEKTINYE